MPPAGFEQLLKDTIGLDADVIGSSAIVRAVEERRQACRLSGTDAYWDHLRASDSELQELIEAVIVPETWFFRDREAFAAVAGPVVQRWLAARGTGVFRLLSVPCSTGEEPYTMAMALLDAGLAPGRFRIDAVDVSERSLAKARRGVYGKGSFRGDDLGFRARYFDDLSNAWRLAGAARTQVTFQQSNLLDAAFLRDAEPYDVIFCRNLLIYFDRPTQDRATAVLARLLAPDGFLFVGPSETGLYLAHQFPSAKLPMAFAFRHPRSAERPPAADSGPTRPVTAATRTTPQRRPAPHVVRAAAVTQRPTPASQRPPPNGHRPATDLLADAQRLADQGRFGEAAGRCEEHLKKNGPSTAGFYLLGLVHDASGRDADAEACYRKALYLDPAHAETLVHLALLLERRGEQAAAQRLRDRAKRVDSKQAR